MENRPQRSEQQIEDDMERRIRAKDRFYSITHVDPTEEATMLYPVVRSEKRDEQGTVTSPRRIESGWMLVGSGKDPNTGETFGKFVHIEPDGKPAYKWLSMDAQNKLRRMELERNKKIFKPGLGRLAVRAVEPSNAEPFIEPVGEQTKSPDEMRQIIEAYRAGEKPAISPDDRARTGDGEESQPATDEEAAKGQDRREELNKTLDKLTKNLSETDKTALWLYANAINYTEEQSQMKKMSLPAQQQARMYRSVVQSYRSGDFARYSRNGGER